MKIYVNAQKLAVFHLNLAVSWIHANGESSKYFRNKSEKGFEFAWLCRAPITPRFDAQPLGVSRRDAQSMEPPRLLLLLEKKNKINAKLQSIPSGRYAQIHQ